MIRPWIILNTTDEHPTSPGYYRLIQGPQDAPKDEIPPAKTGRLHHKLSASEAKTLIGLKRFSDRKPAPVYMRPDPFDAVQLADSRQILRFKDERGQAVTGWVDLPVGATPPTWTVEAVTAAGAVRTKVNRTGYILDLPGRPRVDFVNGIASIQVDTSEVREVRLFPSDRYRIFGDIRVGIRIYRTTL